MNDVTVKDSYPLPRSDDSVEALSGARWFSTLDLKSGYWQVELDEQAKEKTAFSIGTGLWQFTVMSFGLSNAPATFERLIEQVLAGLPLNTALIYLDDVLVAGCSFAEHMANLRVVPGFVSLPQSLPYLLIQHHSPLESQSYLSTCHWLLTTTIL